VEIETHIDGPWNGWVRLKYEMTDYWTGEPLEIDDKIFLATSRPPFGGLRWWFVCPHLNRRVCKLYLPLGGRLRRARKLRLRLGGDPTDDEYPDKPPRMRWATYNRLMDRLVAADGVTEERLKAARVALGDSLIANRDGHRHARQPNVASSRAAMRLTAAARMADR
jgi:hypothetical protein